MHRYKYKHQNMSLLLPNPFQKKEKKQRSEAAPLTLLALHLYSQTSLSKLSLHCSMVARVGYNTYNNCQTGLVSFFKIVRVKVFVFWGGCGIPIEAYTCLPVLLSS